MKPIVCLPTRNEIESIDFMIDKIKGLGLELFISDSNSTDGTQEAARNKGIEVYNRKGEGKGYGIREALEIAHEKNCDVLVLIDCDSTYPVEAIPVLLNFFPEYDLVVGARKMDAISLGRRLANLFFTTMINVLFGASLSDVNSGLRLLKVEKFLDKLDAKGFDIESQIVCRALKDKQKIKEITINYNDRTGTSKVRFMDSFVVGEMILKERFFRR